MPNYGDSKYWEERYTKQEGITFDWLEDYDSLKTIISEFSLDKKTSKVLMLGCGNSEMSEDMYSDGWENITNIDISNVVIQQMTERCKDKKMKCK